ncbi:MAG: six-hairpin glycosidase-like protein, partial [Verrucomicrobia bacterium]|nr:six-hairpin glycosidase-like protein [Cytophagales bacterium]
MTVLIYIYFSWTLLLTIVVQGQEKKSAFQHELFWKITRPNTITWNLASEKRLPHQDNIEMGGQLVSAILHYEVDNQKQVHISRSVLFPQLRRFIKSTDPDYAKYRAYLRDEYEDDMLPVISLGDKTYVPGNLDSVSINGKITFFHHQRDELQVTRTFLPAMTARLFIEKWTITNTGDTIKNLKIGHTEFQQTETGLNGLYRRKVFCDAKPEVTILPHATYEFAVYFSASLNKEPPVTQTYTQVEKQRNDFIDSVRRNLVLESPDTLLNTLFYFSKIRAAESIFQTKMGLVHSPGGGNYYTGVWANDQAEYSGPFFPYLGYKTGNEAAMNAYRMFLRNIPKAGEKIWASFEMDGDLPCCSKDRGDAAMIAFGASHFLLASGNKSYATELLPLLEWCLAWCEKNKIPEGVIASASDELEGRFPTGTANLSTSCLYYGALKQMANLATAMGKNKILVQDYQKRATLLKTAIENYFGAE